MTVICAVAGKPVLHSRSPAMFNAAFRALSMDAVYTRIAASGGGDVIETAQAIGIRGLNITSPFKEEVMAFLDEKDAPAHAIGAVNTAIFEGGLWKGCNTDYLGVRDGLRQNGVDSRGKRVVVLGASGAGRAAVFGLLSSASRITLVNRSFHKAREWAKALGCASAPVEDLAGVVGKADILISCITSGERVVPPSSLRPDLIVFDANYARDTALGSDAAAAGCRIIDGREWLLYQALPAFRLMTGHEAPEGAMRAALYGKEPSKPNIGLIGFMGAGKSTAGVGVASLLNMKALDTDEAIAAKAGLSIPEIFAAVREEGFRALEEDQIDCIRRMISPAVVSFGGGAVRGEKNLKAIKETCVAIWLWASPDTVLHRIGNNSGRPLADKPGAAGRIPALLRDRLPFYARASDLVVNTDGKTPEETIKRICYEIDTPL